MEKLKMLLDINGNYIIIGLLVIFYTMEQVLSTPFKFNNRPRHLFHNVLFQVVFVIANYFFAMLQVFSIEWFNNHHVGLLYLLQIPYWLKLLIGVALFDMTTYWFHRMAHKIPLLWRLHRVHHSDTTMDSTTFFRGHPLEILVFGTSNIVAAAIFGLDLITLGLYFFIVIPLVFVEHTNLLFPRWIDSTLGWIFVTPNLHKVHHQQNRHYTDSNFADIFIIWDRLFGTYKYLPVKKIKYGLKEFDDNKKQTFLYQMKSPFINIKRITSDELAGIEKKPDMAK
jgi:sterol desaturase/sphingolipid hydroxylase (fatty acid hydroxylase superfamily)